MIGKAAIIKVHHCAAKQMALPAGHPITRSPDF
jgi:hypothetical protein